MFLEPQIFRQHILSTSVCLKQSYFLNFVSLEWYVCYLLAFVTVWGEIWNHYSLLCTPASSNEVVILKGDAIVLGKGKNLTGFFVVVVAVVYKAQIWIWYLKSCVLCSGVEISWRCIMMSWVIFLLPALGEKSTMENIEK